MRGLYKSEKNRANCTAIADSLGELNHQSLNHLLSESPWDYDEVQSGLQKRVNQLFGGLESDEEVGLLFDEVGFRKKGNYSACVGRQYLGCLGKQDNGQVAVVAALSTQQHYCPIKAELFMPQAWQEDWVRRKQAKIPKEITHRSKPQMVTLAIDELMEKNLKFHYIAFDALYGNSFALIKAIDARQLLFIGDIKESIKVFTSKPHDGIPKKQSGAKGRKFKYPQPNVDPVSVKVYQEQLDCEDFSPITLRRGTKKEVKAWFHQKQIWIDLNGEGSCMKLQLLIRKDDDGTIKYSLSNDHFCGMEKLAIRQGQRIFIEKVFEEGKNQIGMGDYQVRSWQGFHKHITLCMLAFYYLCEQKIIHHKDVKLTAPVIRKLVASTIVSRWNDLDHTIELCYHHLKNYHAAIRNNLESDPLT